MRTLLLRLLQEGRLTVGSELEVDGRRYRVTGFDPVSVRPRGVYVQELETRSRVVVELVDEP